MSEINTMVQLTDQNIFSFAGMLMEKFNHEQAVYIGVKNGRPIQLGGEARVTVDNQAIKLVIMGGFIGIDQGRVFSVGDMFYLEVKDEEVRITTGNQNGFEIFRLFIYKD